MSNEPLSKSFALREEIDAALTDERSYDTWSQELIEAHSRHKTERVYQNLRFQLITGFAISMSTLFFDLFVLPHLFGFALGWRLVTILPLTLAGLFLFKADQIQSIKLFAGLSLITFGTQAMILASFGNPEVMVRYAMGTTLLLGIATFALPFTPNELKRFGLGFALATSLATFWPNPLPTQQAMMYLTFTALVAIPSWCIARQHWELNARAFLLDLRDDVTRQELEQNNELLRQLSEQDPLTGMANRRHFERVCSDNLANPELRGVGRIALMMIDLDHFKAFNDRHGHQAGDRCLTMVGSQLQEVFGKRIGIIARYGGEEFVAALQEQVAGEAESLAEDMCQMIAKMLVPVRDDSKPLITTSIGVALAPADTRLELEDLIEMADVALYSAKRAGRNRVEFIETGGLLDVTETPEQGRIRA
ncbi:MAG: GGDEF domain-containing protein [Altererythrobacter sp.]|nr:GGDEF domain-containing protein [Altererythrobacter sp.]NNE49426.1 GGDEF domain-containing protein [Altererythrobacter sp.]NNK45202.1 GGDEF domain-containing protein [Altererythrobacter sp.]